MKYTTWKKKLYQQLGRISERFFTMLNVQFHQKISRFLVCEDVPHACSRNSREPHKIECDHKAQSKNHSITITGQNENRTVSSARAVNNSLSQVGPVQYMSNQLEVWSTASLMHPRHRNYTIFRTQQSRSPSCRGRQNFATLPKYPVFCS
jgi:hypothetical protein